MLKDRLSSESGATLVLALVFFLLCAVAGSVILVSGSGAAGRLADIKDDQQSYYSVSSAAKVLKSEITGHKYSVNGGSIGSNDSALAALINEGLETVANGNEYKVTGCSMNCDETADPDGKLDVLFDFDMAANRNIIIKIKKTDSDGHIEYQSTLTAIALSTTDAASGNQIVEWPGDSVTIAKYK